jgi:glycosyltransferase involved in cell wall biosynthesis
MLEPWALNQKKWKKQLAWWLYQRHDLNRATFLHATAISEAQQLKHMGLSVPVEVVPNGVTLPSIQTRKSATERTVLFLSRIHPKKGLLLLADAWAKVRPSGWKMLVVGPDEDGHRNEVQNRVSELGIGSSWEFQDSVFGEQKTQVFQQAAIFVLPTHSENFGIAIAEALSCGLPVITTTQAPWEGLITNRCGWWVPADSRQLASALAEATSLSLEELHQMGERGRRWVQDEFAWPSIAERLLKAYDKYVP